MRSGDRKDAVWRGDAAVVVEQVVPHSRVVDKHWEGHFRSEGP